VLEDNVLVYGLNKADQRVESSSSFAILTTIDCRNSDVSEVI
jgi:hypothetical protein